MNAKENEILNEIYLEMQALKKAVTVKDERRVGVKEFAKRLNVTPATLYNRIKEDQIMKPLRDGKLSYWLNSYVNEVVTRVSNSATVAA
ncbi:MAG: hypothetical protein RR939_08940 [Acinetobacter sp.]